MYDAVKVKHEQQLLKYIAAADDADVAVNLWTDGWIKGLMER